MSRACTPVLVGVTPPVLEKKLMQVGIGVTCMHTYFGGCGYSGFEDIASLYSFVMCILSMHFFSFLLF